MRTRWKTITKHNGKRKRKKRKRKKGRGKKKKQGSGRLERHEKAINKTQAENTEEKTSNKEEKKKIKLNKEN